MSSFEHFLTDYDGSAIPDGAEPMPGLTCGHLRNADAIMAELVDALLECAEYFDRHADADHDYEAGFIPNKEMQLLSLCEEVLNRARKP